MGREKKILLAKKIVLELSKQEVNVSDAKDIFNIAQKMVEKSVIQRNCVDDFKDWI